MHLRRLPVVDVECLDAVLNDGEDVDGEYVLAGFGVGRHVIPQGSPSRNSGVPPTFRTADQIGSNLERVREIGWEIHEI
jgi:hypothetical protein